ncbi:hypothetical protein THAOC_17926, partial [Thalassiosira oceanica]
PAAAVLVLDLVGLQDNVRDPDLQPVSLDLRRTRRDPVDGHGGVRRHEAVPGHATARRGHEGGRLKEEGGEGARSGRWPNLFEGRKLRRRS